MPTIKEISKEREKEILKHFPNNQGAIAKATGFPPSVVWRCIARLMRDGKIEIVSQHKHIYIYDLVNSESNHGFIPMRYRPLVKFTRDIITAALFGDLK